MQPDGAVNPDESDFSLADDYLDPSSYIDGLAQGDALSFTGPSATAGEPSSASSSRRGAVTENDGDDTGYEGESFEDEYGVDFFLGPPNLDIYAPQDEAFSSYERGDGDYPIEVVVVAQRGDAPVLYLNPVLVLDSNSQPTENPTLIPAGFLTQAPKPYLQAAGVRAVATLFPQVLRKLLTIHAIPGAFTMTPRRTAFLPIFSNEVGLTIIESITLAAGHINEQNGLSNYITIEATLPGQYGTNVAGDP